MFTVNGILTLNLRLCNTVTHGDRKGGNKGAGMEQETSPKWPLTCQLWSKACEVSIAFFYAAIKWKHRPLFFIFCLHLYSWFSLVAEFWTIVSVFNDHKAGTKSTLSHLTVYFSVAKCGTIHDNIWSFWCTSSKETYTDGHTKSRLLLKQLVSYVWWPW